MRKTSRHRVYQRANDANAARLWQEHDGLLRMALNKSTIVIPAVRGVVTALAVYNRGLPLAGACRNPVESSAWTPASAGVTTYTVFPERIAIKQPETAGSDTGERQ